MSKTRSAQVEGQGGWRVEAETKVEGVQEGKRWEDGGSHGHRKTFEADDKDVVDQIGCDRGRKHNVVNRDRWTEGVAGIISNHSDGYEDIKDRWPGVGN